MRAIHGREEIGPAGAVAAHDPHVQLVPQLPDRGIQLGQREEAPVAQPRQDPSLRHLHRDFDLGLVAGLARPGRQDCRAIMLCHLGIGPVQPGVMAVCLQHSRLQIVGHDHFGHSTKEGEQPHMRAYPIFEAFRGDGFGIGVVRCTHRSDEQLHGLHFTAFRIDHVDRVASEVDEDLLAANMRLPHRRADPPLPCVEMGAEPCVAKA